MWCTVEVCNARGGRCGMCEGERESRGLAQYGTGSYILAARVATGYRDPWPNALRPQWRGSAHRLGAIAQ